MKALWADYVTKYGSLVDCVQILASEAYQEESPIPLQISLNLPKTQKSLEKSQKASNGIWYTILKAKELYKNKYPIYKCWSLWIWCATMK